MKTAVVIQARMGSSRLPGKVLEPIAGLPMLQHVIARASSAPGVDEICVATTTHDRDTPVARLAEGLSVAVFRGGEHDVLDRYVRAATSVEAELVVRVTADCPLFSGPLLAEMLQSQERLTRETGPVDHYSNVLERTYPRGLDTEIVPLTTLKRVAQTAKDERAREHVTWGIYQHPETYRLVHHTDPSGRDNSDLRWTVDTPDDLAFVRAVYDALFADNPLFGPDEVYALLADHPEIGHINAGVQQKPT